MSRRALLQVEVPVAAPPEEVWAAVTDWPRQSEWILGTTVRVAEGDGRGVGSRIEAYTGVRPLGLLDTMVVTAWQPPRRVEVQHDGRVLRGPGVIEVRPSGRGSVLVWSEDLVQPLGVVGSVAWWAARPLVSASFRRALGKLARAVQRERADRG
ncbi:MAG: SRPBCC family protein [Thermocrispum sp.]